MRSFLPYIFLFFFTATELFCQDTIVKHDDTKVIVKIKQIEAHNIIYDDSEITDLYKKIARKDVKKIVFENGYLLNFHTRPADWKFDTVAIVKIKRKGAVKTYELHDHLNVNLMAGIISNNGNCNMPAGSSAEGNENFTSFKYYDSHPEKHFIGFNIGMNVLVGRSPYIKYVFGINYLNSTGEFGYKNHTVNSDSNNTYYRSTYNNFNIKATDYVLNIANGVRLTLFRRVHIEINVPINIPTYHKSTVNGYELTKETDSPDKYYYVNDSIGKKSHLEVDYAFCPKLSYGFHIKKQRYEIYTSINLGAQYKTPWWGFGIAFYPFKKLR